MKALLQGPGIAPNTVVTTDLLPERGEVVIWRGVDLVVVSRGLNADWFPIAMPILNLERRDRK